MESTEVTQPQPPSEVTSNTSNQEDEPSLIPSRPSRSNKPATLPSATVPSQPTSVSVLPLPSAVCYIVQNYVMIKYLVISFQQ